MPSIPFVLSVLAPLVAVVLRFAAPHGAGAAANLVWLLGLIPVMLATRYLGWKGALYGLLWPAILILITTFAIGLRDQAPVDLTALGSAIVTLAAVALLAGTVMDSLDREFVARARVVPGTVDREQLGLLPGRDVLEFYLSKLVAGARRDPPLSIVLFEISDLADHARLGGAGVADAALAVTARTLGTITRQMNVLGMFDDETFLVLLQGEDVGGAYSFTHRVLEEMESRPAPWDGRIHLNAGVATFDDEVSEPAVMIRRAEAALDAARSLGGSAAVVYGGSHAQALGISGMFILQPDGRIKEVHRTV